VPKCDKVREESHIINPKVGPEVNYRGFALRTTHVLLLILYAAYPRMTADVNVQTANVRAWSPVTGQTRQA
jgi:hypothetical protein